MIIIYVLILLCLISLVVWPYERVAVRRIAAVRRISKICAEREINFKILNHAYFLSSNKTDKFDFILRIEKTVIPVKFFSSADKRSTIILTQSGKISIRRKIRDPFGRGGKSNYRIVEKKDVFPSMRIEKKIIGDKLKCFPVLLNEPPFETIYTVDKNGDISEFYDMNRQVAGCNFVDTETFEELLALYTNRK